MQIVFSNENADKLQNSKDIRSSAIKNREIHVAGCFNMFSCANIERAHLIIMHYFRHLFKFHYNFVINLHLNANGVSLISQKPLIIHSETICHR